MQFVRLAFIVFDEIHADDDDVIEFLLEKVEQSKEVFFEDILLISLFYIGVLMLRSSEFTFTLRLRSHV